MDFLAGLGALALPMSGAMFAVTVAERTNARLFLTEKQGLEAQKQLLLAVNPSVLS
jgi:hypothetical protein